MSTSNGRSGKTVGLHASRRKFLKGLSAAPALPLVQVATGTRPAPTGSKAVPEIFQRFVESHLPDEPLEWLSPKRYSLYMRHFLLREQGDDLLIADGVYRLWLPAGKQISVRNAPTEFGGVVDYTMRRSLNVELSLEIENRRRTARRCVWTPRGFGKISSVKLNRQSHAAAGGCISFQGAKNRVEVQSG